MTVKSQHYKNFVSQTTWVSRHVSSPRLPRPWSLSVLMLCAPVFIFTAGSSALLGRPRCDLSIWLSPLAIFNTLSWVMADIFFTRKRTKHENCSMSPTFSYHTKMTADINTGAQSINTERASLILIPLIWKMFVKSVRRSVFCYNIMRSKLLLMSCSWRKLSIKWLTSPILLFIVSLCSKLQTLLLFDWLFYWMTS